MEKPRNLLISDVELNYARLETATNPFGTPIYEIQIATSDPAKAQEMRDNHLNVKEKDGKFVVSLKRNAQKRDGSDNGKVRVVDGAKMPIDGGKIGNGSTGSVIVWQYSYDQAGRKGISGSLTAVQVTNLVEYNGGGGVDFDIAPTASSEPAEETDSSMF